MVVKDVVIIEIYLIIVELIFFVKNFIKLYGIIYFWFGWMKFVIFY